MKNKRTYKLSDNHYKVYQRDDNGITTEPLGIAFTEKEAKLWVVAPEMLELLNVCQEAISSLDEATLGSYSDPDGGYFLKDELLDNLKKLINKAEGE